MMKLKGLNADDGNYVDNLLGPDVPRELLLILSRL